MYIVNTKIINNVLIKILIYQDLPFIHIKIKEIITVHLINCDGNFVNICTNTDLKWSFDLIGFYDDVHHMIIIVNHDVNNQITRNMVFNTLIKFSSIKL